MAMIDELREALSFTYDLQEAGRPLRASAELTAKIDKLFYEGKFVLVDDFLLEINLSYFCGDVIVGLVDVTYAARRHLRYRDDLLERAQPLLMLKGWTREEVFHLYERLDGLHVLREYF